MRCLEEFTRTKVALEPSLKPFTMISMESAISVETPLVEASTKGAPSVFVGLAEVRFDQQADGTEIDHHRWTPPAMQVDILCDRGPRLSQREYSGRLHFNSHSRLSPTSLPGTLDGPRRGFPYAFAALSMR